jgi:hypothetical protein
VFSKCDRAAYSIVAAISLETAFVYALHVQEFLSGRGATLERFAVANAGQTLGTIAIFSFWPIAVRCRLASIGIRRHLAWTYSAILVISWGFVLATQEYKAIALVLFAIIQLPLMTVPEYPRGAA